MKCIRIGFGKIAHIHEAQLKKHGVQTLGVVEIDPDRIQEIIDAGFRPFSSLEEAIRCKPDFYDVCTPTYARKDLLTALCALDPLANILIEKPVCDFQDIESIQTILKRHCGKVSVNENYASSNVTSALLDVIKTKEITPAKLIVESTKHRGHDFLNGRYVNNEIGALGYEGSHLLAIVGAFGEEFEPNLLLDSDIDDIHLSSLDKDADPQTLSHQGGAFLQYQAKNGCIVNLYTSISGIIGFACPPYAQPDQTIPQEDVITRYKILRVDGLDAKGESYQVVGFYEPISGLARSQAQIIVFKNWEFEYQSGLFEDNTMSQHLLRVINFFRGLDSNPYNATRALGDVTKLYQWSRICWNDSGDSDDALGRNDVVEQRRIEAKKFKFPRE